jgi:hypothetical protein
LRSGAGPLRPASSVRIRRARVVSFVFETFK